MGTVTGFSATRMKQIEDKTVVSGRVNTLGNLILTTRDGTDVEAGAVMDPLVPGTTAQYYRGDKTWQTLDKTAAGLGNVDNTSDVNKPVSTAMQTAIDKLAKGIVLQSRTIANQGPYGTGLTVISSLASFAFKANRKYRIGLSFEYAGSVAGDYFAVDINSASTADAAAAVTGLTKLGGSSLRVMDVSKGLHGDAFAFFNPIADTTLQIKATTFVWSGTGTVTIQSSASNPMTLTIFDEGGQP